MPAFGKLETMMENVCKVRKKKNKKEEDEERESLKGWSKMSVKKDFEKYKNCT